MGKQLRSRILGHLRNYYYERLTQITEELVHTLTLDALMIMIVNEMRNQIFLALGLFYGKYPAENIHAGNSKICLTFGFIG